MKEEIHARTVIMARISSENNDLVKTQAEAKKKKEKVSDIWKNYCYLFTVIPSMTVIWSPIDYFLIEDA